MRCYAFTCSQWTTRKCHLAVKKITFLRIKKTSQLSVMSHPETMAKRSSPYETLSGNSRNNGVEWATRLLCQRWFDRPASISWDAHSLFIQTTRSNTQLWIWEMLFKWLSLPLTFERKSSKCESNHIYGNTPIFGSRCSLCIVSWYSFPRAILFFTVICDRIRKLKKVQY